MSSPTVVHWDRDFNDRAMCGSADWPVFLTSDMAIVTCPACCDLIDPPDEFPVASSIVSRVVPMV